MQPFIFKPSGVCSREIRVTLSGDTIEKVEFVGGCAGNTAGVSSLLVGMSAEEAIRRLAGIRCGFKKTSCPDQLAEALRLAIAERS